jgi:hypothetical protein
VVFDFARVYKVHPLDKIIKGKALDIRTYLIEHDNGGISGTYISLVNIKEKWYVSAFFFKIGEEFVKKLLKLPEGIEL